MSKTYRATLVSVGRFGGEHTHAIESDSVVVLYAKVAGAVEGVTAAGAVVTGLTFSEEVTA